MTQTDIQAIRAQIAALAAFPDQLRRQVAGLSDTAIRFRPAEGEWSVIEVVGHLIDIDVLQRGRIGKMIATDNPPLQPFDMNESVRQRDYQGKQLNALLFSFAEHRAELAEQLRVLRPDAFARAGIHSTRGSVSIADTVATLARHDITHTEQIANNLEAVGGK
jgi:hypothetical protein